MSKESDDLFRIFMEADALQEKPRDEYIKAPFGWPGGKYLSIDKILPLLPGGKVFVDGCGGSGIISLNIPDLYQLKIFNDRHSGVTSFYRCIRDPNKYKQLIERLQLTVHSREEWIWCKESWTNPSDDIERAARWYYTVRYSFANLSRNFGRVVSGINSLARKFQTGLEYFPMIHRKFREIQVENQDVCQLIRDYDSADTVFYIDPDYIGADTGIYENRVQHQELLDTIENSKGFFAVSNYSNDLYNSKTWDSIHKWQVNVTMQARVFNDGNNLANKQDVMRDLKATEVLYIRESR